MPIMAMHQQNDARGSARLLAGAARDYLRGHSAAAGDKVAIGNMYRLLEAYRTNRFSAVDRRAPGHGGAAALSTLPKGSRHLREVRRAFDRAFEVAFVNQSVPEGVASVENVLWSAARPSSGRTVAPGDDIKAIAFLDALIQSL